MAPLEYTTQQKKELVVKAVEFSLIEGHLYMMGPDAILHRYVPKHERNMILREAHVGETSGHYARKDIAEKILRAGLSWPKLHKDTKGFYRACDVCQRIGKHLRRNEIPFVPQVTLQAFDKWAIDFVGPISPPEMRTGVST